MKRAQDKSVIYKSLWIMGTVMILAVLIIELVSIFLIQRDRKKIEQLFLNTTESYGKFWEDKFTSTSKSLLLMIAPDANTLYYKQLCISNDPLTVEIAKIQQQKIMIEMGERYGREMTLFVYVPERNIYFESTEEGVTYEFQMKFKEKMMDYINNQSQQQESDWNFVEVDGHPYLVQIYSAENGYIGAAFSLDRIIEGFIGDREDLCVEVRDKNDEIVISQGKRTTGTKTTCIYSLKNANAKFYVSMDEGGLDTNGIFGTILLTGAMLIAIASILAAIGQQGKQVFYPLEQLRKAMEQYSTGDLEVRLPEIGAASQIGQLYRTFNHMADQIRILRIDVYEKELERQQVRSRFLQVQIQPHFYTNILNLIHGMAQIQDYEEIQKLCRVSASYFRYLMGQKGTFVPLKEEVRCLTSYIEIQHCRYKDMLEIHMDIEPEIENVMILPLIIQTFVGNSVKHNVMLVPHLKIELTVRREGKHDIMILIKDNGVGFDRQILDKINRNESIEEDGEHIGIQNVKERIHEFYGDSYELQIISQPGCSEIRILLPIIEET